MERIVNKAKDHKEAREYEILQVINMTAEQRQRIVRELQKRYYGDNCPDIRETRYVRIIK